ncbi:periplasmic divalent cation tolerance protein [Tepidamorphus gemmatus]|uniref:Periplasmic divalent cation tolerance protein n=2 Tax=Tepidamorphus gemmatus TaxID=747076 RepID=A0A4R3MGF3_9HYPH|nr:periplasmic divalent cation tolerance protein [Tepidamorphus gemmatus]
MQGKAMSDPNDPLRLIYTTFATRYDAERCGRALVERRLAACVNIFPGMTSIYEWQGSLACEDEVAMIVKTRLAVVQAAVEVLQGLHPYDTPAIIVLAPETANHPYSAWVEAQTG